MPPKASLMRRPDLLLIAGILLPGTAALAQVPPSPGEVQRGFEELRNFYRLERRLEEPDAGPETTVETPEPPPPAVPPPDAEQQLFVSRLEVDASAVLEPAEVQAITAPLEGRMATLGQLFDVVERLNGLYRERRCVTCQAFLPAQDVREGVIRIQLVEATVGEVRVVDARYTRPTYYTDRVAIDAGDLFSLQRLERDLVRINGTGQARARSRLAPGSQFGTVDVIVEAIEPPRWQGLVFADNAGRDTIGEYRLGATVINNGVFGRSDPFSATITGAEGTVGFTVAYDLPVNSRGTRVSALYDRSDIDVKKGPFAELDVGGYAYTAGINLTHPVRVTADSRLQAFVGAYAKQSDTEFGSETIVSTKLRSLAYGVEYLTVGDYGVIYTTHALTNGVERERDDRGYFKYNGDLSWQWPFGSGYATVLRLGGQWADRRLIPSQEQFQLGGIATVRGYEEGLLIGDSGYFISGELQAPVSALADTDWSALRLVAFLDHGGAFPYRPGGTGGSSDDFLTSLGVGVNLGWRSRLTGRAYLGVPLNDPFDNQNSVRAHLYVQATF